MANGGQRRTRSERVAALELPPNPWERAWASLRHRDVWGRIGLGLLAAAVMCCLVQGWSPPFAYRTGFVPSRDIVARADFAQVDQTATENERRRARRQVLYTYEQDPRPLAELRGQLRNALAELLASEKFSAANVDAWRDLFPEFAPPTGDAASDAKTANPHFAPDSPEAEAAFKRFRAALNGPANMKKVEGALEKGLASFEQRGLLDAPPDDKALGAGNPDEIIVLPRGKPEPIQRVKVSKVLLGDRSAIHQSVRDAFVEFLVPAPPKAAAAPAAESPLAETTPVAAQPPSAPPSAQTAAAPAAAPSDAPAALLGIGASPTALMSAAGASPAAQAEAGASVAASAAAKESSAPLASGTTANEHNASNPNAPAKSNRTAATETAATPAAPIDGPAGAAGGEAARADAAQAAALAATAAAEKTKALELADRLFGWLAPRLMPTLTLDRQRTQLAMDKAAADVETVENRYAAGYTLVKAGTPIGPEELEILRLEYEAAAAARTPAAKALRAMAVTAVIFAMLATCGLYMRSRQRSPLVRFTRLLVLVLMALATVGLARWASADQWRAEIIPVLLFGMTVAIVYRQELAELLTAVIAYCVVLAVGHGLSEFLLLFSVTSVAILNLGTIRSRRKLIDVGVYAGATAFLVNFTLALVNEQPLAWRLIVESGREALWAVAAGFIMTGLLPMIEKLFGVLTDLSLLELGDVTHPLLQELVRRAPSTYNHSLTMGSIAEAAAVSIGARGLLCRVGAYFHDIGKMLKPNYFVENQGTEQNRHEGLVPAMSTLVIVAHIKDGADLARQHGLPQPIIDLIVQHHGTTLIEYFYDRANERSQADPNAAEVDESSFRYPGPKPQTKEAAVLMLADAVESASRTLVDPAPARIEGLVRALAERRLHDGQFDESGLTLRELRTIERSLVMSLTSIYHGRIKYPEPRAAQAS